MLLSASRLAFTSRWETGTLSAPAPPQPMAAADTTAISVDRLMKSYRRGGKDHAALSGVSFDLRRGERLAYLGPNGAGKTTMIRCLSGRAKPDSGRITMLGEPIDAAFVRDSLGLVPQEIALYEDLTTTENLAAFGRTARSSVARQDSVGIAVDRAGRSSQRFGWHVFGWHET